jgi:hypothetical protein
MTTSQHMARSQLQQRMSREYFPIKQADATTDQEILWTDWILNIIGN